MSHPAIERAPGAAPNRQHHFRTPIQSFKLQREIDVVTNHRDHREQTKTADREQQLEKQHGSSFTHRASLRKALGNSDLPHGVVA